jgi:hypothetical protein
MMHHTKLPLRRWFLAMFLLSQAKNGISALELKRHVEVSFKFAKYAPRYFAEFQFRFNRREDLETMLGSLVAAAIKGAPAPTRRSAGELEARC